MGPLVGAVEVVGGALILAGCLTRLAAIPLLITIPLVFFILPALVIAAMLPALIEAQHGFATMISAGHPK